MSTSSSQKKAYSKFIVPISESSNVFPIDYAQKDLSTFTASIPTIEKYITSQTWFNQYIDTILKPLSPEHGKRIPTAPLPFLVETKDFWKPFLDTAQTTKFKGLAKDGKFKSGDLTADFVKSLILRLDFNIQSSDNTDSYFSRTLYNHPELNSIILEELWNSELEKRFEHLLAISPKATLEAQLNTLVYCLTEMDKCISWLQFSSLKNSSDKEHSYQFSCITSFLEDLISARELLEYPAKDAEPGRRTKPDNGYTPTVSEEFIPYLVENIEIEYNNRKYELKDVFRSLSPESFPQFGSTKKIKLTKEERTALLETCRRQYLDHISEKRSPSDFQKNYQPLVNYIKILSTSINQEMITSYIRQGYIYAFSHIISEYLLQEAPPKPEGNFSPLGYLAGWIDARISADYQNIKNLHSYTIQVIQHLCSFRTGAYISDIQKSSQLMDDVIHFLTEYKSFLPPEARDSLNNLIAKHNPPSPEITKELCRESWNSFYIIWNTTYQASDCPLPKSPTDMTDEIISTIAINLKKELDTTKYLRPKNITLDFTEDQIKTLLNMFASAASNPDAIGAQNVLLNSAAIVLDATYTVYLHHHVEKKIGECIQAVEMLQTLYRENDTP